MLKTRARLHLFSVGFATSVLSSYLFHFKHGCAVRLAATHPKMIHRSSLSTLQNPSPIQSWKDRPKIRCQHRTWSCLTHTARTIAPPLARQVRAKTRRSKAGVEVPVFAKASRYRTIDSLARRSRAAFAAKIDPTGVCVCACVRACARARARASEGGGDASRRSNLPGRGVVLKCAATEEEPRKHGNLEFFEAEAERS